MTKFCDSKTSEIAVFDNNAVPEQHRVITSSNQLPTCTSKYFMIYWNHETNQEQRVRKSNWTMGKLAAQTVRSSPRGVSSSVTQVIR